MPTFTLEKLDEVKDGKLKFNKLFIDGECLYDKFCNDIRKNKTEERVLNKIHTLMNILAESNLQLPSTKFNSIRENNKVIGYEFKANDLRVYVIKKDPNVIVVLGGHKNKQEKDISIFSKIIKDSKDFFESTTF